MPKHGPFFYFLHFWLYDICRIFLRFFKHIYIEYSLIFLWLLLKDSSQSLILLLWKLLVEILSFYKVRVSDIILISQKIVFLEAKTWKFFFISSIFWFYDICRLFLLVSKQIYIENSFIFLWPLLKDSSQTLILILWNLFIEILSLYKAVSQT